MVELIDNKEVVRRFAEEVINERDTDAAGEFLAEDIADSTPFGETSGRDAVVETMRTIWTAFPDFAVTLEEVIAEGETVAVRMIQRGTHDGPFMGIEPTGRSFEIEAMGFARLESGKVVERRANPDLLGLFQQLGIEELPATGA
ncbi:ester cyclase [Halorubellus sp. JP-L1]|uniref:ester cyclase n=1 Tax=Halorubellus sp. JP-L1 TaxID=2715753 RepID=UPI00140A6EAE|nr:ester cyclase [Halorubellus sp. JP-L1]